MTKKDLFASIPYLYFTALIFCVFPGLFKLIALPFASQILLKSKSLDLLLVVVCLLFTSWMILAFLSDIYDITEFTAQTKKFLIGGSLFTTGNITTTVWMIYNMTLRDKMGANNFEVE